MLLIGIICKSQTNVGGSVSIVSISGSSSSWSNTSNIIGSDDSRSSSSSILSTIGDYTDYIVVSNFGFNISAASLIDGIQVNIERRSSSHNTAISDNSVRILKNGSMIGDEKAYGGPWASSDFSYPYGGATDLWGTTWTPADINNSGFGVALSAKLLFGLPGNAEVDNISITISSTAPLPVELTFFKATGLDSKVKLTWETSVEVNNDYFEVQNSKNGVDFETVGVIDGQGNTNEVSNYEFEHDFPFAGFNYYRLKQVDFNGAFEYSDIELVNFNITAFSDFQVYPNPVSVGSNLNVSSNFDESFYVTVYSNDGKVVLSEYLKGSNQIDVSKFSAGSYLLNIKSNSGVFTQKLLVK